MAGFTEIPMDTFFGGENLKVLSPLDRFDKKSLKSHIPHRVTSSYQTPLSLVSPTCRFVTMKRKRGIIKTQFLVFHRIHWNFPNVNVHCWGKIENSITESRSIIHTLPQFRTFPVLWLY